MIKKTSTKENPLTTFRKNFETRAKTVMSSLKKAQDGIAVNDEMSDDLINKSGSTGGYKKPMKKDAFWLNDTKNFLKEAAGADSIRLPGNFNVNIANQNRLDEMQKSIPPVQNPYRVKTEILDTGTKLNQMHPNHKYGLPPIPVKDEKDWHKKGGTIKKTIMKKGGSVKKYEPGGSISSDRVGKNRIVHKNKMYGTDKSGNDFVGKRKTVYDNIGTKDNPVVSNQRSRSKITKTDAVTGDQKTIVTKTNSDGKMTTRNALFAVKQKIGGSIKYKTGGAAKATKFAALAKPFNKKTFADKIAGAKKNASKKK